MHSNLNYNNNYMPEFRDFPNGLKVLSTKGSKAFPPIRMASSPLKTLVTNGFPYPINLPTASQTALEPSYTSYVFDPKFDNAKCRNIRDSHLESLAQVRPGRSQAHHYHQSSQSYQDKTMDANYNARHRLSPTPMIHQAARNSNNNEISRRNQQHQQLHQQRSSSPTGRSQMISIRSKDANTNQHYEHYYSYYYKRNPESQYKNKMSRATLITSLKKDVHANDKYAAQKSEPRIQEYREMVNPLYECEQFLHAADNTRDVHHQVLKEKVPNNNILRYDSSEWIVQMNPVDLINATKEFDVKDVDDYSKNLSYSITTMDGKSRAQAINKSKIRSSSESDDLLESVPLPPAPSPVQSKAQAHAPSSPPPPQRGPSNLQKLAQNNNYEYGQHDKNDNVQPSTRRLVKLPITPFNVKGATENKRTPPRVRLYSSQSPRLSRLSRPNPVRPQESLRYRDCCSPVMDESTKQPKVDKPRVSKAQTQLQQYLSLQAKKPEQAASKAEDDIKPKVTTDPDNDDSSDDVDDDDLDNVSDFGEGSTSDDSSDSEEGYRSLAYKLTHSTERHPMLNPLSMESSEEDLTNPDSLLVPSLFPNVPPYISFSTHTHKGPDVPPELHRLLKWRVSNVMPKVVRYVLANSGMRLVKKTNDWMGVWGKHMKSPLFRTIRPYQKINHLPGSFKIGRKDSCWRNLQKQMNRHGKKEFGFMPKTYIIPYDLAQLRKNWPRYSQKNVKWIIKPPASARGAGIRVVNRWAQIPKRRPLIVQKYIERPLLINGSKFDLRLYVLVTSINPLRVFMYHNGLARFASVKYSDKSETLNDRCMHLTNYSINKLSSNYAKNEDVNACHGHKWTLKSLWKYLANRGIRTDCLWEALRNLVLRTIMAGEQSINNMIRLNVGSRYSCFELFGFDVLLDSDLIPWLLEVNISPSLHSELPLDSHVKAPLVQGVLNTALYNIPPKLTIEKQREIAINMSLPAGQICYEKRMYVNYLSRIEKIKHNTFTRKSMEDREEYIDGILEDLTPDDVRCLIIAEDELARCSPLERIFPTSQTHKYLKFTDTPRYYNRLLDAWETRYGNNRAEGIALLRGFCDKKYHLEVPPPPAKKYFDEDDVTYYMAPEQEYNTKFSDNKIQDSNAEGDDNADGKGDDDDGKFDDNEVQHTGPVFAEEECAHFDTSPADSST